MAANLVQLFGDHPGMTVACNNRDGTGLVKGCAAKHRLLKQGVGRVRQRDELLWPVSR